MECSDYWNRDSMIVYPVVAINDCLEKGPNHMNPLVRILMGLRKHEYAACADVEKAYLQVQICEKTEICCVYCGWMETECGFIASHVFHSASDPRVFCWQQLWQSN